tara:strand:+ start:155 stop:1186 length:1032 start_codon:yes stop_codon:yes gene_type:complete
MKKIIVTGGQGFIGSNLIELLLNKKYFVINIDKSSYSANPYNVRNFKNNKNYIFFKQDINNRKKIYYILKKYKPDGIFNLAAETHVDRSIDDPHAFLKTNIFGVFNLLEALKQFKNNYKKNIKLVHVSTDEVYGDIKKNIQVSEDYNYNPSSPYSASKAGADQLIKSYFRTYNSKVVIANSCNNYGPNQLPEKFIPKVIFNIIRNKSIPVYGKGANIREWIYVKDNCEALIKIFQKGEIGKNYNIGTGIRVKNLEIIKIILKIAKEIKIIKSKKIKIKFVKDRPGHDERYAINSNKIKKNLKWKHKINLKEGLIKTFKWYLHNKNFFKKISKKDINKRFGLKI